MSIPEELPKEINILGLTVPVKLSKIKDEGNISYYPPIIKITDKEISAEQRWFILAHEVNHGILKESALKEIEDLKNIEKYEELIVSIFSSATLELLKAICKIKDEEFNEKLKC